MRIQLAVVAAFLGLAVSGCATTIMANKAKSVYVAEFQCPENDVQAENVDGATAILVKGCGYQQMFVCANGACMANGPRREIIAGPTK